MKVSHLIQQFKSRRLIHLLLLIVLTCATACGAVPGGPGPASGEKGSTTPGGTPLGNGLREVAPPAVIGQLGQTADGYAPAVTIVSPESDRVYRDGPVEVKLKVANLPLFKDPELDLGPHLELFVDNEFARSVYNTDEPLTLDDLAPGTHTLRVFAARPWRESYKNDGAYAQTTFHVIGKTGTNTPDPSLPLLTYNQPRGKYGAEPILLDFYLSNAPLHQAVAADPNDRLADWRIKVTVNGESFLLDSWQPVYLKGFKPGANWVQLEFIDGRGEKIDNVFNTTIGVIEYDPTYRDTLSRLTTGELTASAALPLVDANAGYTAPAPTEIEAEPGEVVSPPEIEAPEPVGETITADEAPGAVTETEPEEATPDEPQPLPAEAEEPAPTPEPEIKPVVLEEIPDLILPDAPGAKITPALEPIPDLILPPEIAPESAPSPPPIVEEARQPEPVRVIPPAEPESNVMDKLRSLFKG